jgi:hypothetical protein
MKLIEKLQQFVKSTKDKDVISTTLSEIREIYKEKEKLSILSKIKYHIFNSVWNRTPNFKIKAVLVEKLNYAIKIGIGVASYNQLPLSWIMDKLFKFKNFLMKDRGHITYILCWMYSNPLPLTLVEECVSKLLIEYKSKNYKDDYTLNKAVSILKKIEAFIIASKESQKKSGLKKSEWVISISDICDSVPEFNDKLNNEPVSIEVKKESIYAHMLEILGINNAFNKWIEFQKAILSMTGYTMQKDGSDVYLRDTLNINSVRYCINSIECFNGDTNIAVFSNAISNYKKKLNEYNEIIPIRFLGLRCLTDFYKRGPYYYASTQKDIETQLYALHTNNLNEDTAKRQLSIIGQIAKHPSWKEYEEERKRLLELQTSTTDTTNLEHSCVGKEDFGMACIDAVMELIDTLPGISDRTSEGQISLITNTFTKQLIKQLNASVEDETLFNIGKTMCNRFTNLILPAFDKVKQSYQTTTVTSKDAIFETLIKELTPYLNGQTKFNVLKFTKESYINPEVVVIDFTTKNRNESNLDLGQKEQTMGYTINNCIVQQKYHNRSSNKVNHKISNIDYWKWFAEENLQMVNDNKDKFISMGEYAVIADAKRLHECFNN